MEHTVSIKIPQVSGPSRLQGHQGNIELLGMKFGVRGSGNVAGYAAEQGPVGRAVFDFVEAVKVPDTTSAKLYQLATKGTKITEVELVSTRLVEGGSVKLIVQKLREAKVESYRLEFDGVQGFQEYIRIGFAEVCVESFTDTGTASSSATYNQVTGVSS
jgi:type VI protein secretion system component Hcp